MSRWLVIVSLLLLGGCGQDGRVAAPLSTVHDHAEHSAVGDHHDHECPDTGTQVGQKWICETEHALLHSRWPFDRLAKPEEIASARGFAEATESAAVRNYADVTAARAAGYSFDDRLAHLESIRGHELEQPEQALLAAGAVTHLVNEDLANDEVVLDPERPDALMYATDGREYVLVGAMFLAPPGAEGSQVGGPMTTWHSHTKGDVVCWSGSAPVGFARLMPGDDRYEPTGGCPVGAPREESPQMLHVWFGATDLSDVFNSEMSAAEAGEIVATAARETQPTS